jgi:hypothetical protein
MISSELESDFCIRDWGILTFLFTDKLVLKATLGLLNPKVLIIVYSFEQP